MGGRGLVTLTFRASSGTVSSPLTTVNRLVCKTEKLRKCCPQSHSHDILHLHAPTDLDIRDTQENLLLQTVNPAMSPWYIIR